MSAKRFVLFAALAALLFALAGAAAVAGGASCSNDSECGQGTCVDSVCVCDAGFGGMKCANPDCTTLSLPNNAVFADGSCGVVFGTVCEMECKTGYTHDAGTLARECLAGGVWSGTAPVCVEINECEVFKPCNLEVSTCIDLVDGFECHCHDGGITRGSDAECFRQEIVADGQGVLELRAARDVVISVASLTEAVSLATMAKQSSSLAGSIGTLQGDLSELEDDLQSRLGEVIEQLAQVNSTLAAALAEASSELSDDIDALDDRLSTWIGALETSRDSLRTALDAEVATASEFRTNTSQLFDALLDDILALATNHSVLVDAHGDLETQLRNAIAADVEAERLRATGVESGLSTRLTTAEQDIVGAATAANNAAIKANEAAAAAAAIVACNAQNKLFVDGACVDIVHPDQSSVKLTTSTTDCTESTVGLMRLSAGRGSAEVCLNNGGTTYKWSSLATGALGELGNPGKSCLHILEQRPSANSGTYYLDPTGSGTPIPVFCEMVQNGGGWTLVYKISDSAP
eukprot:m.294309 g.294309  ORF g.294309 m.294309 type:complete len:519 (+) comp12966_c0_seq1:347-1903(+)